MPEYSVEKLVEHFQFMNATPDDDVLAKCIELCISYKISEEDLVDQWTAFSISNLRGASPTPEGLELLERRELAKNKGSSSAATAPVVQTPERKKPVGKTSYASPAPTKTPSSKAQKSLIQAQSLNDSFSNDVAIDISASQVGSYADRANPGKVLLSFGDKAKYMPCMSPIRVQLYNDEPQWMPPNVQHMFCYVKKQRECQAGITEYIAKVIAKKHGLTLDPFFETNQESNEGTYYGTILCDGEGRLNNTSTMLELPGGDYSNGDKIPLNLSQLTAFSVFPGQVVVVQGKFIKNTLHVTNLFNDGFVPPVQKLETGNLQIIIASGPFTLKNNLVYEPLQDLLKVVLEARPHVLILSGPFLESDHGNINTMTEAFDTFFNTLIESIMAPLQGMEIQVVIVSSLRDVHHFPVYPTPSYDPPSKYPNLLCVPDPCVLNIDGLHVAVTTADVLFNIGKEELSWPPGSVDRMSRLSQYLLNQLSFYPLQSADHRLPIDYSLLEKYGLMETSPHIFVVPSNFRHFVKNISGCTVINPERLVKGFSGGTYARMQISTSKELQIACEIVNV